MIKINRIVVTRGGQPFPVVLGNGDRLDSTAELFNYETLIYTADHVGTVPSKDWAGKGGIVAESALQPKPLYFICGRRPDNQKKVLFIFMADDNRYNSIVTSDDLTLEDETLVGLVPNPAHGGALIETQILFHSIKNDGSGNGSEGCFTTDNFTNFIGLFELGDKGKFEVVRNSFWNEPAEYRKS